MRNISVGLTIRYMHANVASFIFMLMYAHMALVLYYISYRYPLMYVLTSCVIIFILMAGTAFLGYFLPLGQISY
jgi:ubiquinol-cytochrome c reductase cytochrome b subunit